MKYQFIKEPQAYTGPELSNHWIYRTHGILGDAVVAFVGPCDIPQDMMVDLEDILNDDIIYSQKMLHFIVEMFGLPLQQGVLIQRLFSCIIQSKINQDMGGDVIKRRGDDLFFEDTKKLSVSICTVSPTSILIHTGLNIQSEGTPVQAAGLESDLGLTDVESLAVACMKTLTEEWKDIRQSCCKVRAAN